MTQFLVFAVASALVALVTIRRLRIAVVLAIALFVLVPVVASSAVLGHVGADLHPGFVFVLVVFGVQLITRTTTYLADARSTPLLTTVLGAFVVAVLITSQFGSASQGLLVPANQIVGPLVLFALIRRALADDDRAAPLLIRTVILLGALESAVALTVLWGFVKQPWALQLSSYAFYVPGFERTFGTTDHPLVLAGFLVTALCLVPFLRSGAVQATVVVVLVAGLISTQSRTGLLLGLAAVVVSVLRGGLPPRVRVGLSLGLAAATAVFFMSPLSADLLSKFSDDGGSAGARSAAFPVLLRALPSHVLIGGGSGSSSTVAQAAHLPTSLENAAFMYLLDYGAAFTALYVAAMLAIVLVRGRRLVPGGRMAGIAAIVTTASFSSVAVNSAVGAHLWIALALAAVPLAATDRAPDPAPSRPTGVDTGQQLAALTGAAP